jgi:two-component system, OmpR family, sensor histidine kinase TctE
MTARSASIRRDLLSWLMGPLLLLVLLSGAAAYGLTRHFTQTVLDQWLYDSAISLANRVKWENERTLVDLPAGAREILEWDIVDLVYYEVVSEGGWRIDGNGELPDPPVPMGQSAGEAVFYNGNVGGEGVRLLAVPLLMPGGEKVLVKVAETRRKRDALSNQVLWISLALSIGLMAGSAALIWYGIGSGMNSMENAVRQVRRLHADAPLSRIPMDQGLPREVLPLVEEINTQVENLSAVHRLNQRFIADAAHQLRTPLAKLRLQIELAGIEKEPEAHARALNDAIVVIERTSHVVHQLLTLAKVDESGGDVQGTSQTDIALVAREEVERRVDEALGLGVDLGYAGPFKPVIVQGRDALLREAVSNLLDNALRYAASGRQVTVGVQTTRPELFVEDKGPGIPQPERTRACDRFYRLPGSSGDGCGLGLAIVREIARRHHASLVLEGGPDGVGLRARMIFPNA